jgi:hypothetical protein
VLFKHSDYVPYPVVDLLVQLAYLPQLLQRGAGLDLPASTRFGCWLGLPFPASCGLLQL